MALTNGFVTTAATTALDARVFEQGLVVKNANDAPRTGLLYGSITPMVATASMSVSIFDQSVFVVSRSNTDGVVIITNVGAATVSIATAPSANARYDTVYVKHNDTEKGDANSSPVFGVVTGTAAASPVVPAAPSSALVIGTVLVPAGVTATNASGVVITNTIRCTALYGTPIRYRSVADMNADAANVIDGTLAYIKGGELYWMRGGAWIVVTNADTGWITLSLPSGMSSTNAAYRKLNGIVYFRGQISFSAGAFPNGYTDVTTLPVGFRPVAYLRAAIGMFNGYSANLVVNTTGALQVGASSDRSADTVYLGGVSYPAA